MWRVAADGGRVGLDLVFPARCAYCHADLPAAEVADGILLCGECRESLAPEGWNYCRRCGAEVLPAHSVARSCEMCERSRLRLRFDGVVSAGRYRSRLGAAILRMKSPGGNLLSAAIASLYCLRRGGELAAVGADVVVPVPMHWFHRLSRGTNSPDILAERLARHLRVPLAEGMLVRWRKTLPQTSLRPRDRPGNVRGAFRVRAGYDLGGRTVLVADDILTTGATASEVASVLKRAGASRVVVAVLARGVGDRLP